MSKTAAYTPEQIEAERQRRLKNGQNIMSRDNWFNSSLGGIAGAGRYVGNAVTGAASDLHDNFFDNFDDGMAAMGGGIVRGAATMPGFFSGIAGAVPGAAYGALRYPFSSEYKGLGGFLGSVWDGLTGGYSAGESLVNDHIGYKDYDLRNVINTADAVLLQNKRDYMARNNMDPDDSPWTNGGLAGLTTANIMGEAVGSYFGSKGLGKLKRYAGKALSGILSKIRPARVSAPSAPVPAPAPAPAPAPTVPPSVPAPAPAPGPSSAPGSWGPRLSQNFKKNWPHYLGGVGNSAGGILMHKLDNDYLKETKDIGVDRNTYVDPWENISDQVEW